MDWHVQFIVAVLLTFMSIVCTSKTALATAAITPSGSSTFPSSFSSSSSSTTGEAGTTTKYNNHIPKNNKQPPVLSNQGTALLPHDNRRILRKVNHTDNGTQRRSYSSSVSESLAAALNGFTKYTGLQHISTSYNPHATSTATVDHHLDDSNKIAHGAKQQIPIYEEQQEQNDYATAAGASAVTGRENNQHHQQQQQSGNRHSALNQAIYNLHEAGVHNSNYPPYSDYASMPTETTTSAWNYPRKSLTMDWTPTSESAQQFLEANDDKNSASNFQHHYEHNSDYNSPTYSYETSGTSSYETPNEHQNENHEAQYYTQNLFQPNDPMSYYSQYASDNDESNNYVPRPMQEHHFESTGTGQEEHQQQPQQQYPTDVINYVPYPLVKKLHVPVRQNVPFPVQNTIIMPIRKPIPIHIPINTQVQIPVEKDLKIPVERLVPYPVEKHVPVPVEKRVPYPVIRYVAVKVPHPYPIKVPVYKTILHKMKSLW